MNEFDEEGLKKLMFDLVDDTAFNIQQGVNYCRDSIMKNLPDISGEVKQELIGDMISAVLKTSVISTVLTTINCNYKCKLLMEEILKDAETLSKQDFKIKLLEGIRGFKLADEYLSEEEGKSNHNFIDLVNAILGSVNVKTVKKA